MAYFINIINTNIINITIDQLDMKLMKLRLRENSINTSWKYYNILLAVFTWLLMQYLIEWFCNLKANRNKEKITDILNSVLKILYYTK